MKNIILFIIQLVLCCFSFAQKYDIPALKKSVAISRNDSIVSHDYALLSYAYKDQKDSAVYFARKSIETSVNSNDHVKANAFFAYGNAMVHSEYFDTAVFFFQCVNQMVNDNDLWLKGSNFYQLSNAYKRLGQIDLAIQYLFKAIETQEASRNARDIAVGYLSASDFFESINEHEVSLAWCKKADYVSRHLNNQSLMAKVYEKYAAIGFAQLKYDSCLYYFNKALELRTSIGDQPAQAYIHLAIGGVYQHLSGIRNYDEYFEKARIELEKGLEISLACHSNLYTATAYNRLAGLFSGTDKVENYARMGLRYSLESKIAVEEMVAYQYLYEYFNAKKNSDSALFYLQKYNAINFSVFGDKTRNGLISSQYKYIYEKQVAIQKSEFEREQAIKDSIIARNKSRTQSLVLIGIIIISILVIILLFIAYSTQQKKRKIQQKFSQQILQSQEEERMRISKDLHDGIGQNLLLLKNLDPEHAQLIQGTIDDLRTILKNLHPVQLEKIGFTATIRSMMEQVEKSVGIFFSGEVAEIDHVLSKDVEINLYRIIQECLNNIIKHSGAVDGRLDVILKEHTIFVTIQDNGKGFDWKKALHKNSFGITSIIERVNILNGNIHIQSTNGNTRISIEIPR